MSNGLTFPTCATLETGFEAGWMTIRLNRPKVRNALSDEMVNDLTVLLRHVAPLRAVRGITLRGNGGVFCAGGDLNGFRRNFHADEASVAQTEQASLRAGALFHQLNAMPQVVVALVDGAAMAGGLGLVCAADIVAVTRNAKFALTEVTLGIPPAQIAPFIVSRLGACTARRLMLSAARFDGAAALDMGLADFIAETAAELDVIEAGLRKSVHRCAPGAVAITKDIVLKIGTLAPDDMRAYAASGFARAMIGDEGREGIAAFLEKRKPRWAD